MLFLFQFSDITGVHGLEFGYHHADRKLVNLPGKKCKERRDSCLHYVSEPSTQDFILLLTFKFKIIFVVVGLFHSNLNF